MSSSNQAKAISKRDNNSGNNSSNRDKAKGGTAPDLNSLMKSLSRSKADGESSSSNGGNNSDNSALVSLGNTSFGFNFDSEEGMSNNSKEGSANDDSDGSGGMGKKHAPVATTSSSSSSRHHKKRCKDPFKDKQQQPMQSRNSGGSKLVSRSGSDELKSSVSSLTASSASNPRLEEQQQQTNNHRSKDIQNSEAAAIAAANLESIARCYSKEPQQQQDTAKSESNHKRKAAVADDQNKNKDKDASSGGYNTDDDEAGGRTTSMPRNKKSSKCNESNSAGASVNTSNNNDDDSDGDNEDEEDDEVAGSSNNNDQQHPKRKKKRMNDSKRVERNQREKERSFRISKQISELRSLLSSGGIIVPKGTKSSVLTEAANYIRMLQQHQYRSEIDRHQLVQQMQLIGQGAHGPQAAQAIRHFAAQNGVWSLGNFGGVPPKSAMTFPAQSAVAPIPAVSAAPPQAQDSNIFQQSNVESSEYRFIFNSCGSGMAIASMGGAFLDCNQLFCQLSNYTKQEVCSLTIFNMTARQDLQRAFDQISQLISPPMDTGSTTGSSQNRSDDDKPKLIVIRGAMKNRDDLGMSISLVKDNEGIAKCFCVTLIKNPASPFDESQPTPVSFDAIQIQPPVGANAAAGSVSTKNDIGTTPTFTSG